VPTHLPLYIRSTRLSWIDAGEVVDSRFSDLGTHAYLLSLEQMIADARVDIWRQVTQFAIVNYMIILNPISVEVDVG